MVVSEHSCLICVVPFLHGLHFHRHSNVLVYLVALLNEYLINLFIFVIVVENPNFAINCN